MPQAPEVIGRYEIVGILGRGGMATVYLGRIAGEARFSRLFAIKVLHPHLADDEGFVSMLLDEAQIAARIHHPNVVPIVDLGSHGDLRYVVLEYVEGCSLSALLAKYRDARPPRLVAAVVLDSLAGLHAAHMLTDDDGEPMNLVHRDVSPQNVLVGADGGARISDFGVAKAESRASATRPGEVKGKISFLSPEQILGMEIDRRSDIFSAGTLLWTALTGRKLFLGTSDAATMRNILDMDIPPPSTVGLMPSPAFDEVCLRALERDREKRWASAADMEDALRKAALDSGQLGSRREVGDWASAAFGDELSVRRAAIRAATTRGHRSIESDSHPVTSGLRMIPGVGPTSESELDVSHGSSAPTATFLPAAHATTQVSAQGIPHRSSGSGRRRTPLAAAALACLAVLGVAYILSNRGATGGPSTSRVTQSPAPAASASETAAAVSTVANVAPPPSTLALPEPTTAASAPARTLARRPQGLASASPPPVDVARTPARNCDPPFVVDTNGIEHFKPGCI